VTETGWGEFEAAVRVEWADPSERPVQFLHTIRLYPGGSSAESLLGPDEGNKKQQDVAPVVVERYDEVR